jgi:hypothetical protein
VYLETNYSHFIPINVEIQSILCNYGKQPQLISSEYFNLAKEILDNHMLVLISVGISNKDE